MRRLLLLLLAAAFAVLPATAQKQFTAGALTNTTNFDGFAGAGFAPVPGAGELDSDEYAITGFSDGSLAFGGTQTSGDFARGIAAGTVSQGGIYASSVGGDQPFLLIKPGGSDFTPGTLTVRYQNSTGAEITQIAVSYDIRFNNSQARGNDFNFSYSSDDATYTPVGALDFTSPAAADADGFVTTARSTTVTGLSIADGDFFYVRFTGDDNLGGGSRDEIGFDNLVLTATTAGGGNDADTEVDEPTTQIVAATIASTVDTQGEAQNVFAFDIGDSGASDGQPTRVTNIRLKPAPGNTADLTDNIAGLTLNGSTLGPITIGTPAITDTQIDIPITSGQLDVPDSATETITVAVYLTDTGTVDDGATLELFIDADASGFTADASGSAFASPFTGGDVTSSSFTLGVTADRLAFIPDPPAGGTVAVNDDFAVVVNATDANGNVDEDETTDVTIALGTTGTGGLTATGGTTQGLVAGTVTFTAQYDTEETFNIAASSVTLIDAESADITASDLPNVFITEYLEGSGSNNKAIEIYNGSGSTIPANTIEIARYTNGNPTASGPYIVADVLAAGQVYAVARTGSNVELSSRADVVTSDATFQFNGDDAIAIRLVSDGTLLDVFGQIGVRADFGTDETLRRKRTITTGDTNGSDTFDNTVEYDSFPQDTFNGIGLRNGTGATTATINGASGWRMLAAPETGFTVADLSAISLVQGVAERFPAEGDNVFTYDGTFDGATSTEDALVSGQGFIWYLWDNTLGGGSEFPITLTSTGTSANQNITVSFNAQTDVLAGNPFQSDIEASAITVTGGTIQDALSIWDPNAADPDPDTDPNNTGSYVTRSRAAGDDISVWQAFWAETADGATSITIPTAAQTSDVATFVGKRARDPRASLAFRLDGAGVADYATSLTIADDATPGYDVFDLTKLTPLAPSYAAIAFEGEKNGASVLKAIESLPSTSLDAHVIPMALDLVGFSGALTLTWEPTGAALPSGWAFVLVDNVTGDEVDLLSAERYVFEAGSPSGKRARTMLEVATQPTQLQSAQARFTLKVGPASAVGTETAEGFDGPTLASAYPNPFATQTTLSYAAPSGSEVELAAYDVLGRRVARIASGRGLSATQTAQFDASALPSGVYVIRLSVDGAPAGTQTVTVVR